MHTTTQTDIHLSTFREPSNDDSSKSAVSKQPLWQAQLLCHIVSPDGKDKLRVTTSIPMEGQTTSPDLYGRFNFDPDNLVHPSSFTYQYHWFLEDEGLCGSNGEFTQAPFWDFELPCDGHYLITVDVFDQHNNQQTISTWFVYGSHHKRQRPVLVKPSLANLTPDTPTVIDVHDISMIFNIASEQFNSLKEYFIALARRELRFKEFRALDHINFQIKKGEAFGLVGTNGSGKSTMLKIIAGVLGASQGTCSVTGTIAPLIELGAGFDQELTAKENIYLNGALLGYKKSFIDEHFDEIVEFAELKDFLELPLKNYSSGMVARIAFAIATITEPDILIVDETLSVGDFLFQQKCEQRIAELVESDNVTVLLVSHSIELIERVCNRACWIEHGVQRALGPAAEVCAAYKKLER